MLKWVKYVIDDIAFSELKLAREPDGSVSFDIETIRRVCEASQIDADTVLHNEDNLVELITSWYFMNCDNGGESDPIAEDLILEVHAEDAFGGGISHQPGRA
jgi:hypothetical protein